MKLKLTVIALLAFATLAFSQDSDLQCCKSYLNGGTDDRCCLEFLLRQTLGQRQFNMVITDRLLAVEEKVDTLSIIVDPLPDSIGA